MTLFNFSLTLDGVTADTTGLEDALHAAGCDDALICFYGKTVYLEFDRESDNFAHAICSAISDIESANIGAKVISVDSSLVGLSDIAELTELSRQAIAMLKDGTRGPGGFPSPIQRLGGTSPLWRWADVAAWLAQQGKIDPRLADNAQCLEHINLALQLRSDRQRQQVEHYSSLLEHAEKQV
ncbi:helix-turn-helix transcriptional regulator [Serratia marcescens]|uniref:helix-turn-helix transcriptional regulator n=1 Tax=Serratia marcescens TaxID=615 RepID=UPI003FA77C83